MNERLVQRDKVFMKLFLTGSFTKVTEEEVDYFRQNPDLIDEVTAPVNVHKWFLWGGTILGIILVGLSKVLKFNPILDGLSEGMREFGIDIVFEIGVALIGAAVTAYILGILLNKQQDNAATWRAELRRRIDETD
ncbi:MAG: hypothetical protein WBN45_11040 [Arenicellales bacterium]